MRFFIFIFLCFLLSACVTPIKLHSNDLSASFVMEKKWEKTIPTFFFGLIASSKNITVWNKCQKNKYTIKISRPFSHIIAAFFTLGIYTPFKSIITCYKEQKSTTDEIDEIDEFKIFNQDSLIKEN